MGRITSYGTLTVPASNDVLLIVDVDDPTMGPTGTDKQITVANLVGAGGGGGVASVTAGDASIAVGGTVTNPTVKTGTLDQVASLHPPAASWSNNSQKITSLANGSAASDAAAFGQIPVADSVATDIAQIGTASAAGAIGKWADAGHVHPDPNPLPSDVGLIAWTADPFTISATSTPTPGTIYLVGFWIRKTVTISTLWAAITTAGTGLVAGQSFAGVYDSTGTLKGVTADQATAWGTGNSVKQMALVSSFSAAPGMYYAAILANGTTAPTFRSGAASAVFVNAGLSGAALRAATNGTGTTLPGSLTLASNASNGLPFGVLVS